MVQGKKGFKNKVEEAVNSFFEGDDDHDLEGDQDSLVLKAEAERIHAHAEAGLMVPDSLSRPEDRQPLRPIGPVRQEVPGETKSKRYNLLLRPSTFEGLARIVQAEGGSVNNLINDVLQAYLDAKARGGPTG